MGFRLHRLVVADAEQDVFITRGDCGQQDDPAVSGEEIVGIAVAKEVRVGRRIVRAKIERSWRGVCYAARRADRTLLVKGLGAVLASSQPTARKMSRAVSDHPRAAGGIR